MLHITSLHPDHRVRWDVLARGYKTFYETVLSDAEYDQAWQRLLAGQEVNGLGASLDGRLVGIAHYLFHATVWGADVCYLQDLFVDPAARGQGVARALIDGVAQRAQARGASRYYWLTRHDNTVARALYDQVAVHKGFIRYDHPLGALSPAAGTR